MNTNIRKAEADKTYDTLEKAAYCACLLNELFDLVYANGEPSYRLSECAVKGLAELNKQIFESALAARNMYNELELVKVKE
jgi:hypothetical protein